MANPTMNSEGHVRPKLKPVPRSKHGNRVSKTRLNGMRDTAATQAAASIAGLIARDIGLNG